MNTYPEPPVLVEPNVLEVPASEIVVELEYDPEPDNAAKPQPEPAVVDEPELERGEPLVETLADLSVELVMELAPPTPAVRVPVTLRSPDFYDPLQIFLHETESQEVRLFIVRSSVDLVLILEDAPLSVTCALLELSSFTDLSQKPVRPTPP